MSLTLVWSIGKCDLTDCVHPMFANNRILPTMFITVTFAPKQKHQTNNNKNMHGELHMLAWHVLIHKPSCSQNTKDSRIYLKHDRLASLLKDTVRCFCYSYIVAMQNHSTKHRCRKQFHFGVAERNIHHDRSDLRCSMNINKVSRVKYWGGPGPPLPPGSYAYAKLLVFTKPICVVATTGLVTI